jgi:8-oxo-dGTP diphosphatase
MLAVVSGLWFDENDHLFLGKRKGPAYAGHWETPGGKVEPGETLQQALTREWAEELRVNTNVSRKPEFWMDLVSSTGVPFRIYFHAVVVQEEPQLIEHTEFRFVDPYRPETLPKPWGAFSGEGLRTRSGPLVSRATFR